MGGAVTGPFPVQSCWGRRKGRPMKNVRKCLVVLICTVAILSLGTGREAVAGGGGICVGDINGDGQVGIFDLLDLLGSWGECPGAPDPCDADLDADGTVGVLDLLLLLQNFGPCEGKGCQSHEECDDGDDCTWDVCIMGICYNFQIPDCE